MKHTRTLFALFAVLCLPLAAKAQYFVAGGIAYGVLSETEHTVEVTTKYNGYYHGNITIPSTVTYGGTTYDVVSLGELAFYGSTLTSVTIPTSVTRIKSQCFLYSTGPTSITVPASVADIGMMAFAASNM
ncbi:MAG: leucine-rich repeat protein, partial [Bacteroidales bacterium]|nr:leucine-rich repeat protein [Bacteroidales bacterium]